MKKSIWFGISLFVIAIIIFIINAFLMIKYETALFIAIAGMFLVAGFLLTFGVIISERMQEMKKEKGRYKQYEEEKD